MKRVWILTVCLLRILSAKQVYSAPPPSVAAASASSSVEDFKGPSSPSEVTVGFLGGLALIDDSLGFGLIGTFAARIIERGFVADINDQVFVEAELGPIFIDRATPFFYGTHLRWDFEKDDTWTLFALGGAAGQVIDSGPGTDWRLFPRFGIGGFWKLDPMFRIRGELSHELIVLGASFWF